MPTRWIVENRAYYPGEWDEGIAQRVRAERDDDASWTRVLETIYWWPAREGKQWPATLVPIPEWSGAGAETDAWTHFETTLGLDDGYRWEPLPTDSVEGHT